MKKQTAVEWLEDNMYSLKIPAIHFVDLIDLVNQAKEMEREQMKKCYDHATLAFLETGHFEDYFNKIYGDEQ